MTTDYIPININKYARMIQDTSEESNIGIVMHIYDTFRYENNRTKKIIRLVWEEKDILLDNQLNNKSSEFYIAFHSILFGLALANKFVHINFTKPETSDEVFDFINPAENVYKSRNDMLIGPRFF